MGQTFSGARGWNLAQKAEKNRAQLEVCNDEGLVVNAIFHSILFGKSTYVFTRDNDVFEQWWKAIYLIDTHYHSMRIADRLHADASRFNKHPIPSNEFTPFEGDGNQVIIPHDGVETFRMEDRRAVQAGCALLSTGTSPLTYTDRIFGVGQDMQRILATKARTRGRSTDLFGDMNLHILLDPRKIFLKQGFPALIKDRHLVMEGSDEFPIALNDSELAIFTNEQHDIQTYKIAD